VDDETVYDGENIQYDFDDTAGAYVPDNNNASSAAAAWHLQKVAVGGCNRPERAAALKPTSAARSTKTWATWPAYPVWQCFVVCPTAPIAEKDQTAEVWRALAT
jgi:NADP-reducing hydrogenase subunit HndD